MKQRKQFARWNGKRSPKSRTQSPLLPQCLPLQWTDWTLALRGKFERSWLRRPGLELTLLQPRGPLCVHFHRWQVGSWTVAAEIQLAIRPLLERTFWRGAARGTALMVHNRVAGSVAHGEIEHRGARRVFLLPEGLAPRTHARSSDLLSSNGIVGNVAEPIARVFARNARVRNHGDGNSRATKVRVLEQEALALRVISSHVRIEKLAQRTLVSARPAVVSPAKQIEHPATVLEAAPVSPIGVKGRLGMDRSDFDLERLTDRVVRRLDDRLIAHKERLGKLF